MSPEPAPTRKISRVSVYQKSLQIHLDAPVANRPGIFNLSSDHDNYDLFCSVVLLAYAEEKPIAIYFDPRTVKNDGGKISASAVWALLPK